MGNHLPSRLVTLFGLTKSSHASQPEGPAAAVERIRPEDTTVVTGSDSAGLDGHGNNNSAKVGRNYGLIESPAAVPGPPGPGSDRSAVKGQQSRGVQTTALRPSDTVVAGEQRTDHEPPLTTTSNRRLDRVRSFFLPSRTSKKQREEAVGGGAAGDQQQQQQQQRTRRADSTRRSRFRFYTVRRKPAAVVTDGEHALLPGGRRAYSGL
uniref:Uncharacterized protein n=1 Tax=Anopheles darlingi TaxID=43151 RepID=A0A2M4CKQ8_ANODA